MEFSDLLFLLALGLLAAFIWAALPAAVLIALGAVVVRLARQRWPRVRTLVAIWAAVMAVAIVLGTILATRIPGPK